MTNTEKKTIEVISDLLGLGTDHIELSSSIEDDLGADSLDCIMIIMELENEFNIEISDEEAEQVVTVQDAVNLIEYLL